MVPARRQHKHAVDRLARSRAHVGHWLLAFTAIAAAFAPVTAAPAVTAPSMGSSRLWRGVTGQRAGGNAVNGRGEDKPAGGPPLSRGVMRGAPPTAESVETVERSRRRLSSSIDGACRVPRRARWCAVVLLLCCYSVSTAARRFMSGHASSGAPSAGAARDVAGRYSPRLQSPMPCCTWIRLLEHARWHNDRGACTTPLPARVCRAQSPPRELTLTDAS